MPSPARLASQTAFHAGHARPTYVHCAICAICAICANAHNNTARASSTAALRGQRDDNRIAHKRHFGQNIPTLQLRCVRALA